MALTACCGFAGTLSYEMTGTLPGDAPLNLYSGPNLAFKVTFDLPVNPVPVRSTTDFFNVRANVRYSLDTKETIDIADDLISFYDSKYGGMLQLGLSSTDSQVYFSLFGPVIFSGSPLQPTMLAGTFAADSMSVLAVDFSYVTVSNAVVQAETPEPVTGLLVGAAFLGLAVIRRRFR